MKSSSSEGADGSKILDPDVINEEEDKDDEEDGDDDKAEGFNDDDDEEEDILGSEAFLDKIQPKIDIFECKSNLILGNKHNPNQRRFDKV